MDRSERWPDPSDFKKQSNGALDLQGVAALGTFQVVHWSMLKSYRIFSQLTVETFGSTLIRDTISFI